MWKKTVAFLPALVICCVLLNGCSGTESNGNEEPKSSHQEIGNDTEETKEAQNGQFTEIPDSYAIEQEEVELPDGFVKLTEAENAALSDTNGLAVTVEQVLSGIGAKSIENTVLGNYVNKSVSSITMINVDAYVIADVNRSLLIHLEYSTVGTAQWRVFDVTDANTGNYYYVLGKPEYDVYDCTKPLARRLALST